MSQKISAKAARAEMTSERLRELFFYDPISGVFTRRVGLNNRFKAGDVVGSNNGSGYLSVKIDGVIYLIHRLAMLYVYGSWPVGDTDHIDMVRTNNAISNLRDVPRAENCQNRRNANSDNKSSGLLGVSWHKRRMLWDARIRVDRKLHHLGSFKTAEAAHEAYVEAKRRLHPGGMI